MQPWLGPGWDPSGDLAAIQQEMNQLFESLLGQGSGAIQPVERAWAPPMDVRETKADLRVLVELPEVPQSQIQIEIVEGVLEIRLPKRAEATSRIVRVEAL